MKFVLGRVVATPAALEVIQSSGQTPEFFLHKHSMGDWGQVCPNDKAANDQALVDEARILSAYKTLKGVRIWVLTEADRSATTVLLPSEY